jgi:hypothetical protein
MTITSAQHVSLVDFLDCTQRLDKISILIDHATKAVVITCDDVDEQWIEEFME